MTRLLAQPARFPADNAATLSLRGKREPEGSRRDCLPP